MEEGITITTIPVGENVYMVDIENTYTKKNITVEYFSGDKVSTEQIGLTVFKDLIEASTLGMVSAGTHEVKDFYKSALCNLKQVMSPDDIWEVKCADNSKMFNA